MREEQMRAFAVALGESHRDAMLFACPDLRALAVPTKLLVRIHVMQALARTRRRVADE